MKNKIFRLFLSVILCSLALMSGCAKEEEQRERAYIDCGILESESESENESNNTILTPYSEAVPTIYFTSMEEFCSFLTAESYTEEQKLEVYDLVKRYQRSIERAKKHLPEEEIIVGQGRIDGNKVLLPFSDELYVLNFRDYNPGITWYGGGDYSTHGAVTLENGQCNIVFHHFLSKSTLENFLETSIKGSDIKEYELDGITYKSQFNYFMDNYHETQSWCYLADGNMYFVKQHRKSEREEDLSEAVFDNASICIANSYGYFKIYIYPKEDSTVEKITPEFLTELKISLYPIDPEKPIKSRAISVDDFSGE